MKSQEVAYSGRSEDQTGPGVGVVSFAVGPRNQRYLRRRREAAGVSVCERQNARKIARDLDLEPAVLRHESDLVD